MTPSSRDAGAQPTSTVWPPPRFDASAISVATEPSRTAYTWKDAALYALSVGATVSEVELIYERYGPRVLPTWALVPALFPVIRALDRACGAGGPRMLVRQALRMARPLSPSGELVCAATVTGIFDHGTFATIEVTSTTDDAADGARIADGEWRFFFPRAGGFGGNAPPQDRARPTPPPPARAVDWSTTATSTREQAFLYRLATGDLNPIHVDPDLARAKGWPDVILPGTCTLAYAARAFIAKACGGDVARLVAIGGEFRKPAHAGEAFRTDAWKLDDEGAWALTLSAEGRPDPLIERAFAAVATH